jgi:hypothetical protein
MRKNSDIKQKLIIDQIKSETQAVRHHLKTRLPESREKRKHVIWYIRVVPDEDGWSC